MSERFGNTTPLQEGNEKKRIDIPSADWNRAIARAIREANEPTVLVVDTEAKKELALSAADRMGKKELITVEIKKAE